MQEFIGNKFSVAQMNGILFRVSTATKTIDSTGDLAFVTSNEILNRQTPYSNCTCKTITSAVYCKISRG